MAQERRAAAPLVLVLEDHDDTREMMGFLLDMGGFEVALARTGEEALAKVSARPPAVVILDVGLPGISGLDVARRVRQHPATRNVPMIAVTGWVAPQDVARALEAGCDLVLAKPCPAEILHAEILRLLGRRANPLRSESDDWMRSTVA